MTRKQKIARTAIALLVIDGIVFRWYAMKLHQEAKIKDKKIDTFYGAMNVLASYVPSDKYGEVLHALEVDPIVNYHSS